MLTAHLGWLPAASQSDPCRSMGKRSGKSNWKSAGKFAGLNDKRTETRRLARMAQLGIESDRALQMEIEALQMKNNALKNEITTLRKKNEAVQKQLSGAWAKVIGMQAIVAVKKERH